MSGLFAIVVFIALNIIPADINVFEIVDPNGRMVNGKPVEKVIRFTKQDTGGWHVVKLPRSEFGTYTLEDQKLKIAPPKDKRSKNMKDMVVDMSSVLNLSKTIDWSTVAQLSLKHEGAVSISRKTNEVSVEMKIKTGEKPKQQGLIIRWKEKEK